MYLHVNYFPAVSEAASLSSNWRLGGKNYRNYYYEKGRRYSHTIDPRTGYPANSDILSATVIARDCMTADAYATAFMVLGLQQSLAVLRRTPDVMAYFILAPDESTHKYRIEYSPSLLKLLSTEKH